MEAHLPGDALEVHRFWFGALDARGVADDAHRARWFAKDDEFDRTLRERFGALHAAIARREREELLATPVGRLAYVIVLDQFSRNMFRGTPGMFEHDARALRAAAEGIDRGDEEHLGVHERVFLYMPFMHAEDVAAQRRCVALFAALRDEFDGPLRDEIAGNLDYAERHREIVERFGRFPHRNLVLGRTSTPDEMEFLTQPGSSF